MRSSHLVALGLVASALGLFGTTGCSGDSDTVVNAPKKDAGGDADADADTGSDADADADTGTECPTLSFVEPSDGAQLTESDDADGDFCANGFQYDVAVATSAEAGETVSLFGQSGKIADATVANGVARFSMVQLPSNGSETLRAELAGTQCSTEIAVTAACAGAPTCTITQPTISATHPKLNGVPVADGGDRVSAPGSPYQVAFEVHTSVADGQPVIMNVDSNVSAVSANAMGGVASFPGVTLTPDGDHTVVARCVPTVGIEGQSTATTYTVDTDAPPLSANKVQENDVLSDLQDGDHWDPTDDADPNTDGLQLRICGTTDKATAPDALDLPASLGPAQQNFCVAIGTSSPTCVSATTAGAGTAGDGGCVNIDCPGAGPFDMTLTLRDDAGNPTSTTIQGLTCASELPQVQFLDPVGDGPPWSDIDKRILAASMAGQVQRVDKNQGLAGAQFDVRICTSAATGDARLLAGVSGTSPTEIAMGTVHPDTAGDCASLSFSNIVTFADVTIPQSQEAANGSLLNATHLRAEITDMSNGVGFADISLWVDSAPPNLSEFLPSPLCGSVYQSTVDVTENIAFLASSVPVDLTVTNSAGTKSYQGTQLVNGTVSMGTVDLLIGTNSLAATTTEASGNSNALVSPCDVVVGTPPIVTWQTPTNGANLAAHSTSSPNTLPDADEVAPAWQGLLRVCTNIDSSANPGATVQFSTNAFGDIGSPIPVDSAGCAEFDPADVPEAEGLILRATTSPIDGFSGVASITVDVDVQVPDQVTSLAAAVLSRRQSSFQASWIAPNDHGKPAASYLVRWSRSPILSAADFNSANPVVYSGSPAAPGSADGVSIVDRTIETDYYFGVVAIDAAGNRSPLQSTGPHRASFSTIDIPSPTTGQNFGYALDGTTDINGDNLADLIVGTQGGSDVFIYFGNAAGYPSVPDVTIAGDTIYFGLSLAVVGDVTADGIADIAIGSPFSGNGRVFVFPGRPTWPASLQVSDAAVVVEAGTGYAGSAFGFPIQRIGDFNGDGVDDLAIGAPFAKSLDGSLAVVFGSSSAATISLPTDFGSRAVRIDGVAGSQSRFSTALAGFGSYYTTTAGRTLLASANFGLGDVYAFHGQAGTGGLIPIAESDHTFDGFSSAGDTLGVLRSIGTANPVAVIGATGGSGSVILTTGAPATTGPFGSTLATLTSSAIPTGHQFGGHIQSGTISGTAVSTSILGDSSPDLILSWSFANAADGLRLYIIDGTKLAGTGTADLESAADVIYPMPTGWSYLPLGNVPQIRDMDGDGYGDIALGSIGFPDAEDGSLLILW